MVSSSISNPSLPAVYASDDPPPDIIQGYMSVQSKASVFEGRGRAERRPVEAYYAAKGDRDNVRRDLEKGGFTILAESSLGISWPIGKTRPAMTEDTTEFWGGNVAPEAAQLTWKVGQPAVKIAFTPAGASSGVRPVQAPGPMAPATVMLVWPDPHKFRRCAPGAGTTGALSYDAGTAQPGSFVTGKLEAKNLVCSDGTRLEISAQFKMVILELR